MLSERRTKAWTLIPSVPDNHIYRKRELVLLCSKIAARAHDLMGAVSLALIALAYLVYQSIRRPGPAELFKAVLLAIAFLSWAAHQFWPDRAMAPVFNDIGIALFVLDVFLVIVEWPATSPEASFADAYVESQSQQGE